MISRRALFASRLLPVIGLTLAATAAEAATTTKKKKPTKTAKISPKKPTVKS